MPQGPFRCCRLPDRRGYRGLSFVFATPVWRAVAEALGVSERTLYRKIKRYNLTYLSRVAEVKLDS